MENSSSLPQVRLSILAKSLFIRQKEELALFLIGGGESRRGEKESMVQAMTPL